MTRSAHLRQGPLSGGYFTPIASAVHPLCTAEAAQSCMVASLYMDYKMKQYLRTKAWHNFEYLLKDATGNGNPNNKPP